MIWEGDEQAILSILGLLAETGSASGTVPEWRRYLYAGTRESQERERRVDEADRDHSLSTVSGAWRAELGGQARPGKIEQLAVESETCRGHEGAVPEKQRVSGVFWAVLYYLKELAACPFRRVPFPPLLLTSIKLLNIFLFRFLIASAIVRFTHNTNLAAQSSFLLHI